MFRFMASTILALVIAIGGGTASVWKALDSNESFGAVRIGTWTAYPAEGRPGSDPYSRARRTRDAELPLGQGEGLAFYARGDDDGMAFSGRCTYRVEGNVPSARLWTFHLATPDLIALGETEGSPYGLHSRQLLRRPDGGFEITLSPHPSPGNWISLQMEKPFVLVLTLFDTPLTSTVIASEQSYPRIVRTGCD